MDPSNYLKINILLFVLTCSVSNVKCYVSNIVNNKNPYRSITTFKTQRCYTVASNTTETIITYESNDNTVPFEKPSEEKLSKLEKEFESMVNDFKAFSAYDIACIENDRYRALFDGVAAGVNLPEVYKAFVVLFEDYAPVRIAGRMIYKHLKDVMAKSQEAIAKETYHIQQRTGLTTQDIHGGRLAFLAAKTAEQLTMEQLVHSGIVSTAIEIMGYDSFDAFLDHMDHDPSEALTFETFMVGLQNCAINSCEDSCNVSTVLDSIQQRLGPLERQRQLVPIDQRKKKYSDRYDNMIVFFKQSEHLLSPASTNESNRIEIILQGCLAGAKNDRVVNALRVVYLDYSALRIAGDLIFKLVSVLVKKKMA